MEIVSFSYKNILWRYEQGGIEAEDCFCVSDWGACPDPLQEIMKGLEFGFKASWEVMKFTFGEIIPSDVTISLLSFLPLSSVSSFLIGRGVSIKQLNRNFKTLGNDTQKLSSRIKTISDSVFSNKIR